MEVILTACLQQVSDLLGIVFILFPTEGIGIAWKLSLVPIIVPAIPTFSPLLLWLVCFCSTPPKFSARCPPRRATPPTGQTVIRQTFLDNLPSEFDRKTYLAVVEKLKIPAKTAEKYISKFCVGGLLKHLAHDSYGRP